MANRQGKLMRSPVQAGVAIMVALASFHQGAMAAPATPDAGSVRWQLPGGLVATESPAPLIDIAPFISTASLAARLDTSTSQMAIAGQTSAPGTTTVASDFSYSYLNASASTVRVTFHYTVSAGSVSFTESNGGTPTSAVRLGNGVFVNSAWTTLGDLLLNYGSNVMSTANQSGNFANLASYSATTSGATWGDTNFDYTLGDVLPGQSMAVTYSLGGQSTTSSTLHCCHGTGCTAAFRIGDPGKLAALNQLMGLTFETLTDGGQVPVPATLALAAAGIAGLGMSRRKRKQA